MSKRMSAIVAASKLLASELNQNPSALHMFMGCLQDEKCIDFLLKNDFSDVEDHVRSLLKVLPDVTAPQSKQLDIRISLLSLAYFDSLFYENRNLDPDILDPIVTMYAAALAIDSMDIDEILGQENACKRLSDFADFVRQNYQPEITPEEPDVDDSPFIFFVTPNGLVQLNPTQIQDLSTKRESMMRISASILGRGDFAPSKPNAPAVQQPKAPPAPQTVEVGFAPPVFKNVAEQRLYATLPQELAKRVIAQQEAVETLSRNVRLAKAGLREADKLQGAYLFSGPTGVGKTELAKALGDVLERPFIRFDMSDFAEWHSVSKFISAPPGYVGHDPKGGLLHKVIRENPKAVLLLDEVEKAHPDIYNVLLQVMDDGKLSSSSGEKVDFSGVTLIMTTNAGATDASREGVGFGSTNFDAGKQEEAINQFFSPEFRNRLDGIIPFHHLDKAAIRQVVDKFITIQDNTIFKARGIEAEFTQAARDWLADKGFNRQFGARPLKRLMQTAVNGPISEEILFGSLSTGGYVTVDVDRGKDKLAFEFQSVRAANDDGDAQPIGSIVERIMADLPKPIQAPAVH